MKSVQDVRCNWLPLPLLFFATCAQATEIVDPIVSSQPEINNGSVRVDGKLFIDSSDTPFCDDAVINGCMITPWVIKVRAGSTGLGNKECLRLDVTRPAPQNFNTLTDLALFVVDPFGVVYHNDNRSNSDFRPLVKIGFVNEPGWYTVVVQRAFDETTPVNFTLRYARYNEGNPNCANPTQPMLSQEAAAMGLAGMQEADAAREARRARRNAIRVK